MSILHLQSKRTDTLFPYTTLFRSDNSPEKQYNFAHQLFDEFNILSKIREELTLEIAFDNNIINLKIGKEKLYSLNSKFQSFINAYKNTNQTIIFGKEFTYDPSIHFFNDNDTKILNFIIENHNYNQNKILMNDENIKFLFYLLNNKSFYYNNAIINNIKTSFPFKFNLTFENASYLLKTHENFLNITDDDEYIFF